MCGLCDKHGENPAKERLCVYEEREKTILPLRYVQRERNERKRIERLQQDKLRKLAIVKVSDYMEDSTNPN